MPKYKDIDENGLRDIDKLIIMEYFSNGCRKSQAYFKFHPNISPSSAKDLGDKFFSRQVVRDYIKIFMTKIISKKEITATQTITELANLAYAKATDKLTHDHKIKALSELADIQKLYDPEAPPPNPDDEPKNDSIQIVLPDNKRCTYVIKT
jgi:hypothetical protein